MSQSLQISDFISEKLQSNIFESEDYSLNGLQLDFANQIKKIAASVDVGRSTIEHAAKMGCQLLIVHHGIFWKKATPILDNLRGIVQTASENKISLIAQHLPLDAAEEYGNNFSIARLLELEKLTPSAYLGKNAIGCKGENKAKLSFKDLLSKLELGLSQHSKGLENLKPFTLNFGPKIPEKICIVSGSGCDQLYRYKQDNFDTLITGEPRQFIYHFCKDNKLNVICAGHYVTETLGVKNISQAVAKKFSLEWEFIDEPTGI